VHDRLRNYRIKTGSNGSKNWRNDATGKRTKNNTRKGMKEMVKYGTRGEKYGLKIIIIFLLFALEATVRALYRNC
jgi:hypothetical protein